MAKANFTDKQIQDIIKKYTSGTTLKELREEYNYLTDKPIKRILKENNIELTITKRFSDETVKIIIDMYKNGSTVDVIRETLNINKKQIARILKNNNIDIRGIRKHIFNEHVFDNIDTAEKAYWLGFITADGYVQYRNPKQAKFLRIKLQECDKEHLYKFVKFIDGKDDMVSYEYHNITGNKQYYVHASSNHLINTLKEMGIEQGKSSHEKVVAVPDKFKRDYIRGLFDGDGNIGKKDCNLINSIEVLQFVKEYLNKSCSTSIGKICDHCNTYRIHICKNRELVLNHLYYKNCICLNRKLEYIKNNYETKIKIAMLKKGKNGSDS